MCVFSKPKTPAPVKVPAAPAPPPAPQAAPQAQDPAVKRASDKERKQQMAAASQNETVKTAGAGLFGAAQTATKTAFGQ